MSDKTLISWSDATWNPVSGCTEVSPGCAHCYAKVFAERFRGIEGHYYEHGFDVQLRPSQLEKPLHWTRPRRIFVNSMSDLFHDEVPDEYIFQVFETMDRAKQHTFQLLTKRMERMARWLSTVRGKGWPLRNVILGPTIENQHFADERLPILAGLHDQGWKTMVSYEPALGPVDFSAGFKQRRVPDRYEADAISTYGPPKGWPDRWYEGSINWLICGGESGTGRRPFDHAWARTALQQARGAGVPFFMKQDGALRSEVYDTLPDDLKVREFPS